jgi:serine/threonine-protein kinase SRPK3
MPLPADFFYYNGDHAENLRLYEPGGYHPVHLGDTFSEIPGSSLPRYRTLHKLGYGSFATVWQAEDMRDNG